MVIHDGRLLGYLGRTGQQLLTFLPQSELDRAPLAKVLADTLANRLTPDAPVFLTSVDGLFAGDSRLADELRAAGFVPTQRGFLRRPTV